MPTRGTDWAIDELQDLREPQVPELESMKTHWSCAIPDRRSAENDLQMPAPIGILCDL